MPIVHSKEMKTTPSAPKNTTPQNLIHRRDFLLKCGMVGVSMILINQSMLSATALSKKPSMGFVDIQDEEDIFKYISRVSGEFDINLYRKLIGAANEFKEGDELAGIAAPNDSARKIARTLIANTRLSDVMLHPIFIDEQYDLIHHSTAFDDQTLSMTFGQLKNLLLTSEEEEIKRIMPSLTSDCIAFVVKILDNDELIQISRKVFNPLPNSKIGSKGYVSARVQPNSPTDDIEDIVWQVMDAWSYAVGDLLLGTNPVSSDPEIVAKVETALHDLITTFKLENTLPNCVLSHIDIQSEVEKKHPGTTGIWFQSLAGTSKANQTFDITIEKCKSMPTPEKTTVLDCMQKQAKGRMEPTDMGKVLIWSYMNQGNTGS